jgi:hypothetical protein
LFELLSLSKFPPPAPRCFGRRTDFPAAGQLKVCRIVKLLYHRFDGEAFLNSFVTHLQFVTPASCSISLRLKPCLILSKSLNAFKCISALCPKEKLRTWSLAICINIAIHSPSNRVECYSIRLLHHSYRNSSYTRLTAVTNSCGIISVHLQLIN